MKLMQGAVFRAVCLLFVVMLTAAGGCTFIKKITPGSVRRTPAQGEVGRLSEHGQCQSGYAGRGRSGFRA